MSTRIPRTLALLVPLLALLLVPAGIEAQESTDQEVTLRYDFEPDQVFRYRMTQDQQASMDMGGQSMDQDMEQSIDYSLQVVDTDAEENQITLEFTYDRFQIGMQTMGQSMEWDSEEPDAGRDSPMAQSFPFDGFANVIDESFRIVITDRGELVEKEGFDAIIGLLMEDPNVRPGMEEQFRQMFGEKQFLSFTAGLGVLPEEPVAPDASWDAVETIPMAALGSLETTTTNTVNSIDAESGEERATIGQGGELVLQPSESPAENPMGDVEADLESSLLEGEVVFSVDRGLVVGGQKTTEMSFAVQSPQGQSMSQDQTVQISLDLLGVDDAESSGSETGDGERPETGSGSGS